MAGDAEALSRWYREYHPDVYRLCLGLLADGEEAESAAREVMRRLIDGLPARDARRSSCEWRNAEVLRHCRERRPRPAEAATPRPVERVPGEPALRSLGPTRRDQEAPADVARDLLVLELGALPVAEREALVLHDLEGMDRSAVARAMGVSVHAVETLLSLARQRLELLAGAILEGPSRGAERA